MPAVTFFHNERADTATRTGLYVDDSRAFERFVGCSSNEYDPSLKWYVDVAMPVDTAPATEAAAREWLFEHYKTLGVALETAAERVHAGIDSDGGPWSLDVDTPDGVARVTISAQRRSSAMSIGNRLRDVVTRHQPLLVAENKPHLATVPE